MSDKDDSNGQFFCPVSAVWDEALAEINEIHKNMDSFVIHTQHLPVISRGIVTMTEKLTEMNSTLLNAAISNDRIPLDVVNDMLKEQSKNNAILYRSFGAITLGLLGVIVFLLAGDHMKWFNIFHG